jgi:catechol 2,3-dioxygenase-like lactoylglutathione lyase family enzyme
MTNITHTATVAVPVSDQDRALAFFTQKLGFEPRVDFEYADGARWVEVAPPGAVTQLTLITGRPTGIETGIVFVSADLAADHGALEDVDPIITTESPVVHWAGLVLAGIPDMFLFRDPDGNSFLMVAAV